MGLRRVHVADFRCVQTADLEFDPRFTLISGGNASGKTSLLEALYVLGRGRSFRTRRLDHLIRSGTSRFIVFGEVELGELSTGVGIEGSADGVRAKMRGSRVTALTDLAALVPVQIIDPEVHQLIEEGPGRRRRFLDWGVFHVEHAFVRNWQHYQQVLRQRNAALKARQSRSVIGAWDGELLRLGGLIDAARSAYVERLTAVARKTAMTLLGLELTLSYRSGWSRELGFEAALRESWTQDQELGSTSVGPQRAELAIRLNGSAVKDRISRGQQKLLAASLLMAQVSLFPVDGPARPILLLDDPAAELDDDRLAGLIREVTEQSVQLIVTSLNRELKGFGSPGRRYEVSAGSFHDM